MPDRCCCKHIVSQLPVPRSLKAMKAALHFGVFLACAVCPRARAFSQTRTPVSSNSTDRGQGFVRAANVLRVSPLSRRQVAVLCYDDGLSRLMMLAEVARFLRVSACLVGSPAGREPNQRCQQVATRAPFSVIPHCCPLGVACSWLHGQVLAAYPRSSSARSQPILVAVELQPSEI